jgi:hypothetical protein
MNNILNKFFTFKWLAHSLLTGFILVFLLSFIYGNFLDGVLIQNITIYITTLIVLVAVILIIYYLEEPILPAIEGSLILSYFFILFWGQFLINRFYGSNWATIYFYGVGFLAIVIFSIYIDSYKKFAKPGRIPSDDSRYIPSSVKKAVWVRDHGKCVLCGSSKKLHFDHDIPFSKGGGNTEKNIRLLCEKCNLRKSNKIE